MMKHRLRLFPMAAALAAVLLSAGTAAAGEARIAVAANFTAASKEIGALFEKATGHKAVFSFGSTGQLYTQISQSAPFDVFLAADQARPKKTVDAGFGVPGTVFTYATGRIVLFSMDPTLVKGPDTLKTGTFDKIAIANPTTAPYGAAAVAAMTKLGVYDALKAKVVQGKNIAQTHQFVASGSAQLGFVALSQVAAKPGEGSRWVVPTDMYPVIAQDAVLLRHGANNEAAKAFLAFLKGPEAVGVKDRFGYGSGD